MFKNFNLSEGLPHRDVMFAVGILLILTLLFIPIPPVVLDLGLSLSLAFSALILMVVLWIPRPIELSSFPTILLVVTLLRLALNIASTRLILTEGHTGSDAAGRVIEGFAQFLMGGNFVIGIILFALLITVNFIVITRGAGRIAEVGARFTLDAMPGKQMAIDADLSSGLINEDEARRRRRFLEEESSFFGAMDGASKFVRGDAIAGLIIVFINIIGGMIIGVVQQGMSFGEAAEAYTLLTVGDGLATQVPALIVALSAGLLVTKGENVGSAEQAVMGQLGSQPKALYLVGALLLALGLLPGLPFAVMGPMAVVAFALGYFLPRFTKAREEAEASALQRGQQTPGVTKGETSGTAAPAGQQQTSGAAEDRAEDNLRVEDVKLEVGSQLVAMIADSNKGLSPKVRSLRKRFAKEFGFLLPPVRIRDNVYLQRDEYVISVQDVEMARGRVKPGMMLVINPQGGKVDMPGEETSEPTFGLPARWIDSNLAEEAEAKSYTVVDPESVVTTHLAEVIKDNLPTLLTYAALQRLLTNLDPDYHKLLNDVVPSQISYVGLQRVLQALLAERISIRNLPAILEAVSEAASWTRNASLIAEHVRSRLGPQIVDRLKDQDGYVPVVTLSPKWEKAFLDSIEMREQNRHFAMPPTQVNEFVTTARRKLQSLTGSGTTPPAVLVTPDARPFVRSLLERVSPQTPVISHNELHAKAQIKALGQI